MPKINKKGLLLIITEFVPLYLRRFVNITNLLVILLETPVFDFHSVSVTKLSKVRVANA